VETEGSKGPYLGHNYLPERATVTKVMLFIDEYNRTARPLRWTYDGSPLRAA
jgi:hypothetical protein